MQPRGSRRRTAAAGFLLLVLALGAGAVSPQGGASAPAGAASRPTAAAASAAVAKRIDINSASAAQLATLPGISLADAQRIVAGRPYLSKTDLATRKVLPEGLYIQNKDRIVAIQKAGAPRPAATARKASGP